MASIKKARAKSTKRIIKVNPDLDFLIKVGDENTLTSTEFKRCIMSTYDGLASNVNFIDIKANMRNGLYMIECNPEQPAENINETYDVVTLQKKVAKEKFEKMEQDRLNKIKSCDEFIESDTKEIAVHNDKLEEFKMLVGCDLSDKEAVKTALIDTMSKIDPNGVNTADAVIAGIESHQQMITELEARILHSRDILEKLQEPTIEKQLEKPSENDTLTGNKQSRALHAKLKTKFTLTKRTNTTFVEFQYRSVKYLIIDAQVYTFTIPGKDVDKVYIVIYGKEFCNKLEYMRSIDPTYGTDEALAEQQETFEKIRKVEHTGLELEEEPHKHDEHCNCGHHHVHEQKLFDDSEEEIMADSAGHEHHDGCCGHKH
jgi:hypothetical protein